MSGLFEHLAADDEMERIARRKAIAVATKRVNDRYADFILSEDDAEAINERLDLVADEFDQAVQDACDEHGVEDHEPIVAAVRESFLAKAKRVARSDEEDAEEASARDPRPEMNCDKCGKETDDGVSHDDGSRYCFECESKTSSENMPEWLEEHFEEKNEGASKEEEDEDVAEEEDEDEKAKESSVVTSALSEGEECEKCHTVQEEDVEECPTCRGAKDMQSLGLGPKKEGSTKEARRPKMCPYHKELVNASLQVGEPQYAAFSSLVGSDAHCDGGYEDKCNFKPAMVTQAYWDEKEQARIERKEQRELERQQAEQGIELDPVAEVEETEVPEAVADQSDLSELTDAPTAVGEGIEEVVETETAPEPVLASSRWTITAAPETGDSWEKNESVEQPEGPSPEMDKSKWNGLDPIDTDAGPYQTEQQDVTEGPDYSKQDDLGIATVEAVTENTNAVTEQETLPTATDVDSAGFNAEKNIETNHTDTFDNDGQAEPVTQEVMANTQPQTSEDALNLHTADLLSDIKGFGQGVAEGAKDIATAPYNALKDVGEAAGRAFNENVLEATPESELQQPNMGITPDAQKFFEPGMPQQPTPATPAQPTPQMNQTMDEALLQQQKAGAAHKIKEEEGKFYVVEDGDEKAAGPFDSESEAKERATELNAMENLEKEASPSED